ncbi:MAG: hypothetical protein AAAC47_13375 [Pararhizobium sp.]
MSELDFGLVASPGEFEFEYDVGAVPLGLVFAKAEVIVENGPDDFRARDKFLYGNFAPVQILEVMLESFTVLSA